MNSRKLISRILFILYIAILIAISSLILSSLGYNFKRLETFPFIVLSKKILGSSVNVSYINKEVIMKSSTSNLAHFYELEPLVKEKYKMPWTQEEAYITTNEDGLNDRYNYNLTKDEGTYRIITLGDSFTEGALAKIEDSYPERLEDELNKNVFCPGISKFEVLNFGVGGYDIEYAAQRFLVRGLKYQPDLILWFLKDDDFNELVEEFRERTDQYIASLSEAQKKDLSKWEKYSKVPEDLKNEKTPLWEKIYYLVREELVQELGEEHFFQIQENSIQSLARSTSSKIILFTFNFSETKYKMRMKLWANKEPNVLFFDGVRNIYELGATHRPFDGHPNKEGYRIIMEDIYNYLISNNIVCK